MRDFRKLDVWSRSHALVLNLYEATKAFPPEERYGLTSQVRRAGASIPANIAEGCGLHTEAAFARYLQMAAGSASELQYHLLLCRDLGILPRDMYDELDRELVEVKKMLTSFIQRVRARIQN